MSSMAGLWGMSSSTVAWSTAGHVAIKDRPTVELVDLAAVP
jgi:hypothetical protein